MCLQSYRLLYHRRALTTVFIHRHLLQCRLRLHPECCKQRKSTGKSSAIHSTLRVRTACLHHPVRDGNLTHHSVSLPLWHPTPVSLGAVGYYCVPKGEFVTLFNAFDPRASSDQHAERIPSLHGYGKVSTGVRPRHKRNLVQRLLDDIRTSSSFRFRASAPSETKVARTYVHPQQPGQQAAYLFAESLVHRFMRSADLQVPKLWFAANADAVVELYGAQHEVTRDTLSLGMYPSAFASPEPDAHRMDTC